jgi:glycerophosphodiester phosphodiesterase
MGSFQTAHKRGADYIEFDVQMTGDNVPVIFHDLAGITRDGPIPDIKEQDILPNGRYRYPIRKFSESQFRKSGLLTEYKTERISLRDLLLELPEQCAFDVEVKYPSRTKMNSSIPYETMNRMLDKVIDIMMQFGSKRTMFFSCFDPLICIMLRLKQQRFPVFQLFCKKKRWTQKEMVERVLGLVPLYKELEIQGFVFDCRDLLRSSELVPVLQKDGFMLNTYGELNNTKEGIEQQLALGIRGICTDDVGLGRRVVDEFLKTA